MADPHILMTQRRKQAELQDAVFYLEGKLAEVQAALGHVDAVLRLYEIDDTTLQFPAHASPSRLFKHGDLVKLAKAAMESGGELMTTRELAVAVAAGKGMEPSRKGAAAGHDVPARAGPHDRREAGDDRQPREAGEREGVVSKATMKAGLLVRKSRNRNLY